ncbi:hypothetical protein V6N00_12555 [Tersicoccus sp. MR15.9]|uniref:hypothetical protein n=1 Tax=Tersicoccus mangrovi TaxID=3121635 RepID=UPI002FE51B9B
MTKKMSAKTARQCLEAVADWLGPQLGYTGPAPTGSDAARSALGPELNMAWDWPNTPTPTILLEGGPDDWAIRAAADETLTTRFAELGVFAEPYASYALCLYPA